MARKSTNNPAQSAPVTTPNPSAVVGDSDSAPATGGDGAEVLPGQTGGAQDAAGTPPADLSTPAPLATGETVPARILRDCWLGAAGQLIELDAAVASAVAASGAVDLHERAVAEQERGVGEADDPVIEDED